MHSPPVLNDESPQKSAPSLTLKHKEMKMKWKEEKKPKKKKSSNSRPIRDAVHDKSILVVDDNPLIVRVLEKILEGCRHLQTASNGQEALNIVTQRMKSGEEFDLIFMDCLMPVMDGYTATQTMRQLGYKGPILALTGNSSEQDAEKAREAGFNSSFVKPIRTDDLLGIILQWTNPIMIRKCSSSSPSESSLGSPPSIFDYTPSVGTSLLLRRVPHQSDIPEGHHLPSFGSDSSGPFATSDPFSSPNSHGNGTERSPVMHASDAMEQAQTAKPKKKLKRKPSHADSLSKFAIFDVLQNKK